MTVLAVLRLESRVATEEAHRNPCCVYPAYAAIQETAPAIIPVEIFRPMTAPSQNITVAVLVTFHVDHWISSG